MVSNRRNGYGTISTPAQQVEEEAVEEEAIPRRSEIYLIFLTNVFVGIQFAWAVEVAYVSPYLLSLGLPKYKLSLIWLAGPLSGTFVQPIVGLISDRSKLFWGRRRPFLVAGLVGTILGFIGLGFTRELVYSVTSLLDVSETVELSLLIGIAVCSLIVLDISINAMMAVGRALIVDVVPYDQQELANGYAGGMHGLGNLIGYANGYINLPLYLGFLGKNQFQILCILTCAALSACVVLTCAVIDEKHNTSYQDDFNSPPLRSRYSLLVSTADIFVELFYSLRTLPKQVRKVCFVQSISWVGWFLFLVWNTTWTGNIYLRNFPAGDTGPDGNERWEDATRVATFALLINAIISLISNFSLIYMVDNDGSNQTASRIVIRGLTISRLWCMALFLFGLLMLFTMFVDTVQWATVLVAATGISWAVTQWAPFAIIASYISKNEEAKRIRRSGSVSDNASTIGNFMNDQVSDGILNDANTRSNSGAILGIHNIAICIPQFVGTLIASIVFKALGNVERDDLNDSVGWVLRIGGLFTLIASLLSVWIFKNN